jgi:hypothetical protein
MKAFFCDDVLIFAESSTLIAFVSRTVETVHLVKSTAAIFRFLLPEEGFFPKAQ